MGRVGMGWDRMTRDEIAHNSVGLSFLRSASYIKIKSQRTKKLFAVGKSGPNASFNLFFLGLCWPWNGFVGFKIIFVYMFSNPT